MNKPMRCECGSTSFSVTRTDHDEDNLVLRIRTCRNCKAKIATEERLIPLESFFGRAVFHDKYRVEAEKRTVRRCRFCDLPYRGQSFSRHCATKEHLAALKHERKPAMRRREREAKRRSYWKNVRGIDLATAAEHMPTGEKKVA